MTFQSLLQEIMTRNGLTQRKLAERACVNHISLCRILNESYAFRPGKVIGQLVEAVGCTAEERIELYRLGGILPPEVVEAFCASAENAKKIYAAAVAQDWKHSVKAATPNEEFRPLRRDLLCPSEASLVSTMPAPSGGNK